jgi:F-box/leucine-rich repeat protein 2/20
MRRRDSPDSSLNLTDCRFVTPIAYNTLASATKPRNGWSGWVATPFGYVASEVARGKGVLKTFWSWRRVAVPRVWEEMRAASQNGAVEVNEQRPVLYKRRRNSWWREQDPLDDRGCVVM